MIFTIKKIINVAIIVIATFILLIASHNAFSIGNQLKFYTDESYLMNIPFGTHSHWLQPWRAYLETVPAKKFLDGIGIVFQEKQNPKLIAQMLAKHGVRHARFEISWGMLDYGDETKLITNKETEFKNRLIALKNFGIRPLILLNSNHGLPCPIKLQNKRVTTTAHIGDRKIILDSVNNLSVGYSGLSNISGKKWAAEALITEIRGNQITISKPLSKNIMAGSSIEIATLKYKPFSSPGTIDYQETLSGWFNYINTIAGFVTKTLETENNDDKGFDLEIWNELTFGSNFLNINSYYEHQLDEHYSKKDISNNLIGETARYIDNHSNDFLGVKITNGFANTIPWPASSQLPPRIHALSKHPYPKFKKYPQDEPKSKPVNALGLRDLEFQSKFTPHYSTFFPESSATGLLSSTIVRDMAPITSEVHGVDHGRYGRKISGQVVSTPIWITEANVSPSNYDPNISNERALKIKAKAAARYFCFFLNKGAERLYLFAAGGRWKDNNLAVVQENFLKYAFSNSDYPIKDDFYISPALKVLKRICDQMTLNIDSDLVDIKQLKIISITDSHNHYQFQGNNIEKHPNLYNRDVFTFLPFQVNQKKFVIPYYIMTRNLMEDMVSESFTIKINGEQLSKASVQVYDPINNRKLPVSTKYSHDNLSIKLTATDYPYLLIINNNT
ncbi:hypothetical protein [Pleurocapsa sp. CCALA 161]|uniref:hypothetical protein n=1 Tax=Pleurocapsa sp. CCALA 161 TaxID=2107688 RepID=UPI0011B286B2|nr:hypothetical protein [Pleurocapsa sp. CCALA 161]